MRYYLAFDDTDIKGAPRGTGRFTRDFYPELKPDFKLIGIVRQQYPQSPSIPFTSNNSSATMILEADEAGLDSMLVEKGTDYIARNFVEGSDPGLCVANETNVNELKTLADFGLLCCGQVMTKEMAMNAARGVHLSEHGGTGDGIIGAAAGVGLAHRGWSGRFVELGSCNLRNFVRQPQVRDLEEFGIKVISVARLDMPPLPTDKVETYDWVRPRLWGGQPALAVHPSGRGLWTVVGVKEKHQIAL